MQPIQGKKDEGQPSNYFYGVDVTNRKAVEKEYARLKKRLCGYTCDLLSWVMGHGQEGMAWVTVQTHMNVIAVASLMEMAAVIIPEGIQMEQPSLDKAKDEGITVLQTKLTAYEICARLAAAGLAGK